MTVTEGKRPNRIARLCATTNGFAELGRPRAAAEDARLREKRRRVSDVSCSRFSPVPVWRSH